MPHHIPKYPGRALAMASLLAMSLLPGASLAENEDADLTTQLARLPSWTVGDLIPPSLRANPTHPYRPTVEARGNGAGERLMVSVEILGPPDMPGIWSLLYTESLLLERAREVVSAAERGHAPGGIASVDLDASLAQGVAGVRCVGLKQPRNITCLLDGAALQFSVAKMPGSGEGPDYTALRKAFASLPLTIVADLARARPR